MKLNNSALQELWEELVNRPLTISPYVDSPTIYKAFRECDEKLSESATFEKIKKLEKDLDDAKNQLNYFTHSRDNWRARAKYAEDEVEALKKDNKRLQNNVRAGYDQGQTDLWVALQNVNDFQPFEIATCFPDVTGMEDILNWDLEDFLDAYKKWYEEKEKERLEDFLDAYKKWYEEKEKERLDHMRDYLARFCEGRLCEKCPLGSDEYKCGCGYSFRRSNWFDARIIPDEELERYYDKARGCGKRPWHGDATAEKMKDAFDAAVEVNKDLLEKVCGVKPKEEEHNLEYGDAVRVPWRDYDYMYIGRDKRGDGKMIRLFNPKNHSVVYVSSNNHLDIRGYKITIGNEEDLRKIWCDKDADKE